MTKGRYRGTKSRQQGSWSLAHLDSLTEVLEWVTPCSHYCILDTSVEPPKVIDMRGWDIVNDSGIWNSFEPEPEEVKIERVNS